MADIEKSVLISRVMLDAIEKTIVRQGTFFRDTFFPVTFAVPTDYFEYDAIEYNDNVLPFAGYNAESTTGHLKPYQNQIFKFDCIRHKHVITQDKLEQRMPGFTVYDSDDKIAQLQNMSYGELERALILTEESMCVQALTQGKVEVLAPNGSKKLLATYWDVPETGGENDPVITAADPWDDSTTGSAMLKQILSWKNLIIRKGGSPASVLVLSADLGEQIARALMATPNAMLQPGVVDAGADYDFEGIQYLGYFAGLRMYSCGASIGGNPLLPDGSALLGSGKVAKMMYGPTYLPTFDAMSKVVGRRTFYTNVSRDPVAFANIIQSAPFPLVRRKWDTLYIKGLSA